jgi:hypothetical protein
MNTSTKVRVAIISLLSGSALLLGPAAAGAQAATGRDQPGSAIADVADKPPRLGYDNTVLSDGARGSDRVHAAGELGDAPTLGFRGSIRLSPQAATS